MCTGTLPFRGETSGVIFESILNRAPAPATRLNPDLPPKAEDIIKKALEKDRNLRYQHASDIRTDLQRLKRDRESSRSLVAIPPEATSPLRMRSKVIVGVALVLVLMAVGGYLYFRHPRRLTDKDVVVLTDFANSTGDTVFDATD